MKHGPGTDLEDLDFEAIDKEIEADEVTQATQIFVAVDKEPLVPEKGGNDDPIALLLYLCL